MVVCSRPAAASLLCRVNPRSDSRDGECWEAAWWVGWEGGGLCGGDRRGKGVRTGAAAENALFPQETMQCGWGELLESEVERGEVRKGSSEDLELLYKE